MSNNYNNGLAKRHAKLAAEDTALSRCRSDLSDVRFEIKSGGGSAKIILAAVAFSLIMFLRIFARRKVGNPEHTISAMDMIFFALLGILVILAIVTAIMERKKPNISVSGKTLFYNGSSWTSDEIACVKCSKFLETVAVYSAGKKILSFPWSMENSELFIAWVKKCCIVFEDNRINY